MSDRKPMSVVLPAVGASVALLGLYVGTYYATVESMLEVQPAGSKNGVEVVARYPALPGRAATLLFAPVNRLDREIRPHFWEVDP